MLAILAWTLVDQANYVGNPSLGREVAFVANTEARAGQLSEMYVKATSWEQFQVKAKAAQFEFKAADDLDIVIDDMCWYLRAVRVDTLAMNLLLDGDKLSKNHSFSLDSLPADQAWMLANEIRPPGAVMDGQSGSFGFFLSAKLKNPKVPGVSLNLGLPPSMDADAKALAAHPVQFKKGEIDSEHPPAEGHIGWIEAGWLAGTKYGGSRCSYEASKAYMQLVQEEEARMYIVRSRLVQAFLAELNKNGRSSLADLEAAYRPFVNEGTNEGEKSMLARLEADPGDLEITFDFSVNAVFSGVPSNGTPGFIVVHGFNVGSVTMPVNRKP